MFQCCVHVHVKLCRRYELELYALVNPDHTSWPWEILYPLNEIYINLTISPRTRLHNKPQPRKAPHNGGRYSLGEGKSFQLKLCEGIH